MEGLFLLWSGAICYYDLRFHRIPNLLTYPAAVVCLPLVSVHVFGLAWPLLYVLVNQINRIASTTFMKRVRLGGGDYKLAISLGLLVGDDVLIAIIGAQIFTLAAIIMKKTTHVAHGPAMLAAAIATVWLP
ncbi:A24 family peptidase [Corynebacterium sp. HS2168-gen11]|uniref:prepilin peptidase n=1 Tax=Corynebacterium sp. HS2168-gen11 TaxID=2974027 RepID=UPI00216B42CA|nr:A24 family peptidase [Corynebacterium sp. HS2168-gen11]MCS4535171.1 A24 family peptidase [Corynebacterium sp. HS2168-gen11]